MSSAFNERQQIPLADLDDGMLTLTMIAKENLGNPTRWTAIASAVMVNSVLKN